MSKTVSRKSISSMYPIISEIVNSGGSVKLEVKGNSMMPFLRSEKDSVLLKEIGDVQQYDVVLFKTNPEHIALHRIVNCDNGTFTIIGDNQYVFDRNIKKEDLIAKAVEFHRGKLCMNEKFIRVSGMLWFKTFPLRNFIRRGLRWIKRHFYAYIHSPKNNSR